MGARIVYVAHRGAPGGLFDRADRRGAFIDALAPLAEEAIVVKLRPNAFSGTDLALKVGPSGTSNFVASFTTHNCVSSTVRAALDLGLVITVAGDACATRDLPSQNGVVPAHDVQRESPHIRLLLAVGATASLIPSLAGAEVRSATRRRLFAHQDAGINDRAGRTACWRAALRLHSDRQRRLFDREASWRWQAFRSSVNHAHRSWLFA